MYSVFLYFWNMYMYKIILMISISVLSGCATLDKAMTPVDKGVNSTKSVYQKTGHSVGETINNIGDGAASLSSSLHESSLFKLFKSDKSIFERRSKDFVVWKGASKYKLKKILKKHLKKTDIKNPDLLEASQKMIILKDHFFDLLKKQHADNFSKKFKKPTFNEFLTDRENIQKIHEYKSALLESEHEWRLELRGTQKKVAQMMLSTLYSTPVLKYVSYNPYEEEIFFEIEAANGNFKEKIKLEAKKDVAINIKDNISRIQPYVFYKFDNDVLAFVDINLVYEKKPYAVDVVGSAYVRQTDVVFRSGDISLEDLNVQYYKIVKNVKPPKWFNKMNSKSSQIIGYGEGISKSDAKKEAFKEIAMSIKTTISSKTQTEQVYSGSISGISSTTTTEQIVEDISIKGSKVLKVEKKDGLWFVAILY